jgi:tetratricopeptide (TPR) repeat protein
MLEIAEEIGSASGIAWGVGNMVNHVFSPQGEYEAGLAFLETWLARAKQAKDTYLAAQFQRDQVLLLTALGQLESAVALAQTLLSTADGVLERRPQMLLLRLLGYCQAQLGRFHQARESYQAGLDRAEKDGETVDVVSWLIHLAYVAYLEGDQARLRAAMEGVQRRDVSLPASYTFSHSDAARLYLALGEVEKALESSRKAMQEVEAYGAGYFVEQYCLTHACVLRALVREAEADDYLQRAYDRVMLVAGKTQDEALRRGWLENVPDNREIVAEWEARAGRA